MVELSISEAQHERLEAVREDVEATFVDTYGRACLEDALEYLLDTYSPPGEGDTDAGAYDRIPTAEYPELQRIASDVPDVPGSGIDADEMRGKLLTELGPREFAARLETVGNAAETGEPVSEVEDADGSGAPDDGVEDADGSEAADDGVEDDDGSEAAEQDESGGLLTGVNRLLEDHADKWRESDGEAPYEVDLPDGSTESARTKDDVRRILFRQY
jgi:hypothetical protein